MNYGGPFGSNPNNNYGIPNYQAYPQYVSPQQMTINQPNNSQNISQTYPLNQYTFVNGIEGAEAYQMPPNRTMLLMDNKQAVCYMKSTNNIGQSILKCYTLQEVDESIVRNMHDKTQQPQNNYVTQSDFKTLSDKVDNLLKNLKSNRKEGA